MGLNKEHMVVHRPGMCLSLNKDHIDVHTPGMYLSLNKVHRHVVVHGPGVYLSVNKDHIWPLKTIIVTKLFSIIALEIFHSSQAPGLTSSL